MRPHDDNYRRKAKKRKIGTDPLNRDKFKKNKEEFKKEYGGSFIAILEEGETIESLKGWALEDFREFKDELRQKYSDEKIKKAFIKYVEPY